MTFLRTNDELLINSLNYVRATEQIGFNQSDARLLLLQQYEKMLHDHGFSDAVVMSRLMNLAHDLKAVLRQEVH